MTFPGYIDDEQLTALYAVLDDYCAQFGLDAPARNEVAVRILDLFSSGVAADEINRILREPKHV